MAYLYMRSASGKAEITRNAMPGSVVSICFPLGNGDMYEVALEMTNSTVVMSTRTSSTMPRVLVTVDNPQD